MISSGLALFYQLSGSTFDPVKTIQELQSQNRRDEALDLVQFYKNSGNVEPEQLETLEKDLQYTSIKKTKSFIDGAITGRVNDTYSGIGAIGSDLCIYGDVRDLTIQTWRFIRNEDTDVIVVVLSGVGILLSAKPYLDVVASFSKNTVKYIKRFPGINSGDGTLKKMLNGNLSIGDSKFVYDLFKKTTGPYPGQFQS